MKSPVRKKRISTNSVAKLDIETDGEYFYLVQQIFRHDISIITLTKEDIERMLEFAKKQLESSEKQKAKKKKGTTFGYRFKIVPLISAFTTIRSSKI